MPGLAKRLLAGSRHLSNNQLTQSVYTTQRKVQKKYILKEVLYSYTERTHPSEVARRKSDVQTGRWSYNVLPLIHMTEEHSDAMESQPLSQSQPLARHISPCSGWKVKADAILTGSGWMWLKTQTLPLLFVQHVFSLRCAGSLSASLSCSPSSTLACIPPSMWMLEAFLLWHIISFCSFNLK